MDFLVDIMAEAVFEGLFYGTVSLVRLIIPRKEISERTYEILHKAAVVYVAVGLLLIIAGIVMLLSKAVLAKQIGKYLILAVLFIFALQIILGIVFRIISKIKAVKCCKH